MSEVAPRTAGPPPLVDLPDLPHAWSTPYLALWDTLRVAVVVVSLYLVYLLAYNAFTVRRTEQRMVSSAFALAVMLSVWTQVERIGRPLSWRFPVVAVMAVMGVWGALRYMSDGRRIRELTLTRLLRPPPPPPPPPAPPQTGEPPDERR